MIGLILAAGRGRRIESITNGKPKSFLKLGGVRLIDHQIQSLKNIGIKDIVIVAGYRFSLFEKDYKNENIILIENSRYHSTNVIASVWEARDYLGDGFYFFHADTYVDPKIVYELKQDSRDNLLAINKVKTAEEEMKVTLDSAFNIKQISKTLDPSNAYGEFTGVAKFSNQLSSLIVSTLNDRVAVNEDTNSFFEVIIQDLVDLGFIISGYDIGDKLAIEIDTPEDYYRATDLYNNSLGK